jgi:hypothetical protein
MLRQKLVALLARMPRFFSFDAGLIAGLLGIGAYLAIVNRHWLGAVFLLLGILWMVSVPYRLRAKSSDKT